MPEMTISGMMAMAGMGVLLLILWVIGTMLRIETIEELTVAFAEDMPLQCRKELLMQEIASKQELLESRYLPEKIRSFDAYYYKDGLEEELDFDHLEELEQADFVYMQYVISK